MQNEKSNYMISIDDVNEGIAVFRYSGDSARVEYANQALRHLLHFSVEQVVGATYEEILAGVHPDDVEKLRKMIQLLPETKVGNCAYKFKDYLTGEYKSLSAHGKYKTDENGALACFAYSDISIQVDAMEREQRLSKCIRLITDNRSFAANMNEMMECLREQYWADRAYIFEFDWTNNDMSNRVETTAPGVSPEIDSLQNLPVEIIGHWLCHFQKGEAVYIENLDDLKADPARKDEYEILVVQNIHSLMVVPIMRNEELYGYIGVDNQHRHVGDRKFLNYIAFLLSQEYLNRLQQQQLKELSLCDPLTGINNRHAYNQKVEQMEASNSIGLGVIFSDVNGLKYVNDRYGHVAGDDLICKAVGVMKMYFKAENLYRISGDEFVVLEENIHEADFLRTVEEMKIAVTAQYGALFSVGEVWNESAQNIEELIRQAEKLMYSDKAEFYAKYSEKNRRGEDLA